MRSLVLYSILAISLHADCIAQAVDWQFDFLDITSLPNEMSQKDLRITSAAQDRHGFIWLATNNGILRYDGVAFSAFAPSLNPQIVPFSSYNHQMRIGPSGDIWLISPLRGMLRIVANGQACERYSIPNNDLHERFEYSDVFFENDSVLWVTTSDYHIHRHQLSPDAWQSYEFPAPKPANADLSFGTILADPDRSHHLWISSKYGLFLFDIQDKSSELFDLNEPYRYFTTEWLSVMSYYHGCIFIGAPSDRGIDIFDVRRKEWRPSLPGQENYQAGTRSAIAFTAYSDSLMLVGTYKDGEIGQITLETSGEFHYTVRHPALTDGALNYTQLFVHMNDGSIGAIGDLGFTRISITPERFHLYALTDAEHMQNNWQRSFLQGNAPGTFLLGTMKGDGLIEVDWQKKTHHFFSGPMVGATSVSMWALAKDRDGNVWIGTEQGLMRADVTRERMWQPADIPDTVLKQADIHFLQYSDPYLWVSTTGHGLYLFNPENNISIKQNTPDEMVINGTHQYGNAWLLATNLGLLIYDPSRGSITDIIDFPEDMEFRDILAAGDSLWLTTHAHGLWCMHGEGKERKLIQYLNPEVYRANLLDQILPDTAHGHLWLNTGYGFAAFDLQSHRYVNYTIADGIEFTRRNLGVFERLHDGAILASANRHFQYFYPDSLSKSIALPSPYLKEVTVNGNPIYPGESEQLHLPSGVDNVSFKMGALNLNVNPVNYYSYRMLGISENWSPWSGQDFFNYSELRGGVYAFELRAANKLFEWSETYRLDIRIDSRWIETLWFRVLTICIAAGLIYLLFWYRNRQTRRENTIKAQYQKQINALQMNALQLQMNPHFVFNSINSINYYIIQNERDKASHYLAKFSRLIRQILENSKEKLITLEQELDAISLYLEIEQVRFEGRFDFEVVIDEQVLLSGIMIPPLILQPYVENAIWHGLMNKPERGHLSVHIRDAGDQVNCIIEDDGIGRTASAHQKAGKPPRNQSLGTRITKDRLKYIEDIYGIHTDVRIEDLSHFDGSAAGTRVIIKIPKLKSTILT